MKQEQSLSGSALGAHLAGCFGGAACLGIPGLIGLVVFGGQFPRVPAYCLHNPARLDGLQCQRTHFFYLRIG